MIINLLQETLDILKENNKFPADVLFCNMGKYNGWFDEDPERVIEEFYSFSFEEFAKLADFHYNNDSGRAKVNLSLQLIGRDFWLERYSSYNGHEGWRFQTIPSKFPEEKPDTLKRPH